MAKSFAISCANIHWRSESTPESDDYQDVYFSKDQGETESQYVFLKHNQLAERFKALPASSHFVIGETGFGTGLNFLLTLQLFEQHAHKSCRLFFISTEKHPLTFNDITHSHQSFQALKPQSERLLKNYPAAVAGMHILPISPQCQLTLMQGDAAEQLQQLIQHPDVTPNANTLVDAWFLDGFAPSKNPSMWHQGLFKTLAKLSHRGTTLASFTAAGIVRRGLQSAGFRIQKTQGFGRKRDMIIGQFQGLPSISQQAVTSLKTTSTKTHWPLFTPAPKPQTVMVIGAGIAGCTCAYTLAQAGIKVTLIDQQSAPMQQASGNPQAVLFPKLTATVSAFGEFNLLSYLHSLKFYQQESLKHCFSQTGLLDLPAKKQTANKTQDLLQAFAPSGILQEVSAQKASELAGQAIKSHGLYYPDTGFINTQALAQALTNHENITFVGNTFVTHLQKQKLWQAHSHNQTFTAEQVVVALAKGSEKLLEMPLPCKNIRGQITGFCAENLPKLNCIVCQKGYICPSHSDGHYYCGASFDLHQTNSKACDKSAQQNLQNLANSLPEFNQQQTQKNMLSQRVNFRYSSPDYLPIVGPVPNVEFFNNSYQHYRKNAQATIPVLGQYHKGLWLNTAYGSRGFSSAPLMASVLRAHILQEPSPIPQTLANALNPARFIIKALRQNRETP